MKSGLMPFSSSTWITPMCAKPRAAPPPSARPMRGGFGAGVRTGSGGGSGGGAGTIGAGGGAIWQPASAASAAPAPARSQRLRAIEISLVFIPSSNKQTLIMLFQNI
jgi:hypothetical protein